MTQKAAASLTSSLFARKGKASPARLLISELEASGAATHPAAPGARAANGRRRAAPAPELPLLAYVEARAAAEEAAEEGGEEAAPAVEPPPAASLLEHGARSLRRVNGHGAASAAETPAMEAEPAEPVGASEPHDAPAGIEPVALEPEAQVLEPETISGDGNVAAIEDAPQDDESAGEAALEPAGQAADDVSGTAAEPEAAVAATVSETAASETKSDEAAEAPAAAVQAAVTPPAIAPVLPATLALRKAAALQTTPPLAPEPAVPPPSRTLGFVWRSAAVVALGAALGLGLYLALSGEPAPPSVATAPAPAAPPATTSAATPAATPAATAALTAAPAEPVTSLPTEAPAAPDAPAVVAAAPEPSFDIIRIEPDGQSIIAGRAAPGSEWILLNNGSPIAAVRADANGEWVVLPDAALLPGANAFSLVPKDERGKVAIPAPAPAAPAEADAPAAPLEESAPEPRAEAAEPGRALPDLPRPKPPLAAAAFEAAPAGPYEVQLASVRQSADANRERLRLSQAYPALLGGMDLRVQEARLDGAGIFYRVRSGAIGQLDVARDLCRRLEAAGQGCLVVRRPEAPPEAVTESAESVPDAAAAVRQQAERPQ